MSCNHEHEDQKQAYYCFREAVKDRGYTMDEIKTWTYAGGFWGLGRHACPDINNDEDDRLRRKWVDVMGKENVIPDDERIEDCICGVHIKWAHIIVDDPQAEAPEYLIIGSECVKCYSNDGDGLKTYKRCDGCNEKHRCKGDLCKKCKKLRWCERNNCPNMISKGKREFCDSCRKEKNDDKKRQKKQYHHLFGCYI